MITGFQLKRRRKHNENSKNQNNLITRKTQAQWSLFTIDSVFVQIKASVITHWVFLDLFRLIKEQNLMEESDLFEMIREIVSSDNSFAIADSFLKKNNQGKSIFEIPVSFLKSFRIWRIKPKINPIRKNTRIKMAMRGKFVSARLLLVVLFSWSKP